MLRLLIGTDWVCIRDEILNCIADDVAHQKDNRYLIVPELISHDMERRLCAAAGDTASRYAEVLSFSRLARRVSDWNGFALEECLDEGGRFVAMAAAAQQMHSRLKTYAAVETKPEFLTEVLDAVDEFKRCCISPEDLLAASAQTQGTLAQKMEELSLLVSAYDSLCSRGKRDPRDQMTWLLEQMEECDFAAEHVFYIDGFPDFTRQHMALLEHMIKSSALVTVGINCDEVDSAALAFEKAGATAKELVSIAHAAGVDVQVVTVAPRNTALHAATKALFQGKCPQNIPTLQVMHAQNPAHEVRSVCAKIMELVRNGSRYRDIGVVCSDVNQYRSLIELQFNRCNIPTYISGTEDILQKSVVATVLAAADAVVDGFEQRSVLRYLRSVLSPLTQDMCDSVENYAVVWGIHGKRWQEQWQQHPDGLGQEHTQRSNQLLAQLNEARAMAIDPLVRLRDGLFNAADLAGQVDALYAFLQEIQLTERLEILADEMDRDGDNPGAQILDQLWQILMGALEQMRDVLGNTLWEPDVFLRLLRMLLSQYDVGTIPPVLDSVTVGPVSAMRCQQVKHLFVLGADEGKLPGYAGSSGLLSDKERTVLRSIGVSLTGGAMEGIQAEFAEIYGVFCGATQSICVSYSGAQPSYVYRRLLTMSADAEQTGVQNEPLLADRRDAGAFLSRWDALQQAKELDAQCWYEDTQKRKTHNLGSVSEENIKKLYGQQLNLSASQVDLQAQCRLSYFLKYGLYAKERKSAQADPAEFGTYVHAVLEKTARKVMELGGFSKVSLEQTLDIAFDYSKEYIQERFSQMDSSRLMYLFHRNRQELQMVVQELWQELKDSAFEPLDFELKFAQDGKMPAIEIPDGKIGAALRGFVDRVDIWKKDDKHYFRVVDYKTGKKSFDYCDVYNGVGLQMLLYLFALEQSGADVVGEGAIAAGVQYFPARAGVLSADGALTEQQAQELRRKEWVRKGLLLNDDLVLQAMQPDEDGKRLCCSRNKDGVLEGDLATTEQLRMLRKYVFALLRDMVDDIASGNVTPNPYTRGTNHDACTFCPYGSICNSENVPDRRNYQKMEADRFWQEVEKEVYGNG